MAYTDRLINHDDGLRIIEQLDKLNRLTAANIRHSIDFADLNWSKIEGFAHEGVFADLFEFGDQFVDTWTDKSNSAQYSFPWQFSTIRDVELKDGETLKNRPVLGLHYAHPFGVQFSHQRAFLRCPEGLSAGTYYLTIVQSWGSNVIAGDVVCFTLTLDVPAGGRLSGCYGAPDAAKSNWKIYSHSADGKTILETVIPTFEVSGTDLGIQKHNIRNGNLNSTQEMAFGWNRWKTSALRQYLNSDKDAGQWWAPQDEWDIAPDQLTTKAGFLTGLPEDLKSILKETKIITYANTVNDGGEMDITFDKVFIPSLEEIYVNPQIKAEGGAHEYYIRKAGASSPLDPYGTYPQMITYAVENHTSPQYVRLRSASRGTALGTWYVGSSGTVISYSYAGSALRFSPLVVI